MSHQKKNYKYMHYMQKSPYLHPKSVFYIYIYIGYITDVYGFIFASMINIMKLYHKLTFTYN